MSVIIRTGMAVSADGQEFHDRLGRVIEDMQADPRIRNIEIQYQFSGDWFTALVIGRQ
jgi:hypothetical protein